VGSRARRLKIPIAPIAYSAIDERGPLLNLGELAKRSGGTLRWARTAADIGRELANLGREIRGQRILTFRVGDHCATDRPVRVIAGSLRSNEMAAQLKREKEAEAESKPGVWLAVVLLILAAGAMGFVTWLFVAGIKKKAR
jgi:hypothetical protein